MADVKFSDLTAVSLIATTDLFCISQGGTVSKKVSPSLLGALIFTVTTPSVSSWFKATNLGLALEDAATTRTSLGGTTLGQNFFTQGNPSAIRFFRSDASNGVIQEDASGMRGQLGLAIGTNVQAWDADLDAISATTPQTAFGRGFLTQVDAAGTRSYIGAAPGGSSSQAQYNNAGVWGGIPTITYDGTFAVLDLSASASTRIKIKGNASPDSFLQSFGGATALLQNLYWDGTNYRYVANGAGIYMLLQAGSGWGVFVAPSGIAGNIATMTLACSVSAAGVIFDGNGGTSDQWDLAYARALQWDGGATGLVAATGRTSLALNNVTNDTQTKAAVVPNTAPSVGQLLIGNGAGTAYAPQTLSGGSGMTVSLGTFGVLTIGSIPDTFLLNAPTHSDVMPNTAPALGQLPIGNAGGTAYVPRTLSAGGGASVSLNAAGLIGFTNIPNTWLLNTGITIAGTSVNLGGSIAIGPGKVSILSATTSSTYTVPATARALWVELIGGGGGGGGAVGTATPTCMSAGGGAGGGYVGWYIASPAATYTYQCGTGGTAGSTAGGAGGAGNNTTFGAATANGGSGGAGGTAKAVGVGGQGGAGVGGSGGSITLISGDGMAGFIITGGNVGMSGQGGAAPRGGGNTQGKIAAGAGLAGSNYGGGGSGALSISTTGVAGGAGANGIIQVTEYY